MMEFRLENVIVKSESDWGTGKLFSDDFHRFHNRAAHFLCETVDSLEVDKC